MSMAFSRKMAKRHTCPIASNLVCLQDHGGSILCPLFLFLSVTPVLHVAASHITHCCC